MLDFARRFQWCDPFCHPRSRKIQLSLSFLFFRLFRQITVFPLEHPNSFAILENKQDTNLNLIRLNVKIEPSLLGKFNEPSPIQIVGTKDISNPLMGEVFLKNLLI